MKKWSAVIVLGLAQFVMGVAIVPSADVERIAEQTGLGIEDEEELADIYRESQISSLRVAFFGPVLISLVSLLFSRGIPSHVPTPRTGLRPRKKESPHGKSL